MKKAKKAIALLLAGCAVCGSGFTAAFAVTPPLQTPSISIPKIDTSKITVPDFKIWSVSTTVTDATYMHSPVSYMPSCLYVKWDAVNGADKYSVIVTKADGTKLRYVSERNFLVSTYSNDDADSWKGATVSVYPVSQEKGTSYQCTPKEITSNFQQ